MIHSEYTVIKQSFVKMCITEFIIIYKLHSVIQYKITAQTYFISRFYVIYALDCGQSTTA